MFNFFNWIVNSGNFGKVLICNLVHDEACIEYPEDMPEVSSILKRYMEDAAAVFCKKLPIPANASIEKHWVH
jgi:DNA polymerase I-like protein with 3'-5' exonuclease and polymerase domains